MAQRVARRSFILRPILVAGVLSVLACNHPLDAPAAADLTLAPSLPDATFVRDLAEPPADFTPAPGTLDWCAKRVSSNALEMAPLPFTSGLATDLSVNLSIDAPAGTLQEDVEQSLAVSEIGGAPVSGKLSWSKNSLFFCNLAFTPTLPLVDKADYVVTILPRGSFQPRSALAPWVKPDRGGAYRAAFTVGSHPRVSKVVVALEKTSIAYIRVDFSEPVSAVSTRGAVRVVRGGSEAAGAQVWPDAMAAPGAPTGYLQWAFSAPTDTSLPIELSLSGVKTLQGIPLDPDDFQSQTNVNGAFHVTLDPKGAVGLYEWRPTF